MTWRDNVEQHGNCLVWTGRIDANGYARWGGEWAHRRVYEIERGPIPERHELDHTCVNPPCVNPPCVNPDHLEPVTRAEHCRRTMERLGKDERHLSAAYLRTLGMTYADIAELMGYAGRESAKCAVDAAIRKGLVDPDAVPMADDPLGPNDIADMMALRAAGVTVADLARWYGLHPSHASRLSRGIGSRGALKAAS